MSSVLKKADKLNLSLSSQHTPAETAWFICAIYTIMGDKLYISGWQLYMVSLREQRWLTHCNNMYHSTDIQQGEAWLGY